MDALGFYNRALSSDLPPDYIPDMPPQVEPTVPQPAAKLAPYSTTTEKLEQLELKQSNESFESCVERTVATVTNTVRVAETRQANVTEYNTEQDAQIERRVISPESTTVATVHDLCGETEIEMRREEFGVEKGGAGGTRG